MPKNEQESRHTEGNQMQRRINQPLSGFQDIWGQRMIQRERIMEIVIESFRLFGFQP